MKNHEKFLDAMSGISEKHLTVHIRKKCPTKADRIKKYATAAAIYAAACLVIAVVLPFIIGHGNDPEPLPGNDPARTETHAPSPDDPEVKKINAADIHETYNGVSPEEQSDNVTIAEAELIVEAARRAYAEYDVIVLSDGTEVTATPKRPDITLADLADMKVTDPRLEQLREYIKNAAPVIIDALDTRFPESCKVYFDREQDLSHVNITIQMEDYFILNGGDSLDGDKITVNGTTVTYTPEDWDKRKPLHPTYEEAQILGRADDNEVLGAFRPRESTVFNGCRYSLILDEKTYNQYTPITATVVIENDGEETVGLWQGYLGCYLDDVVFFENGEAKYEYCAEDRGYPEAVQTRLLKPGEHITYHVKFKPCDPPNPLSDPEIAPADIDSKWEIKASVSYYPGAESESFLHSDLSTATLTIEVPHEEYINKTNYAELPEADSIAVGDGGRVVTYDKGTTEYDRIMGYTDKLIIENIVEKIPLTVTGEELTELWGQETFVELIYGEESTFAYSDNGALTDTEPFVRLLLPLSGEYGSAIILGLDPYYSEYAVYVGTNFTDDLENRLKELLAAETTSATTVPPVTQPPETTTTAPETTATTGATATLPPVQTTPAETQPPSEEVITYPDPYISNKTDTSITKTLFGCEYTVTIDKPKYEQGDTVNVVVTLANKGKSELRFGGWTFLGEVYFMVNGRGVVALDHPDVYYEDTLLPGDEWSYKTAFNTAEAKTTGVWSVSSSIGFAVNGTWYEEAIEIEVPHDGVDPGAFSPAGLINPFSGEEYWEFNGKGEIIIIMEHNTSVNWDSYLNTEYLGFEIESVKPWTDTETVKEQVAANLGYRAFVTIFLEDKSDEAVVAAINRMHELDRSSNFINYAYPQIPRF